MNFKKIISGVVCAAVALTATALTACKDKETQIVDDLVYDEYGDPVFDNVNLKVWSIVGNPDDEYLELVNKQFNTYYKDSGLSATVKALANSDFYTQLANTINTDPKSAPDVVIIHSERLTKLASDKILLPMDDFYAAVKGNTFSKDNYLANVMKECIYDGKIYGVPLDVHSGMWYVREDILEKNGLEKPESLSEFVDVCNQLIDKYNKGEFWYRAMDKTNAQACKWKQNNDGRGNMTKPFGDNYYPVVMSKDGGIETGWIPQTAVFQNGGQLVGADGKPAWNTQGLEDTMNMFRDWQTGSGNFKGTPYKGAFVKGDDNAQTVWSKLASGEAIFSHEGPWWIEQRFEEYEGVLGTEDGSPIGLMNLSKLYAQDETASTASNVYGVGHCFSVCKTVTSKTTCVAAALYAQYMTEHAVDYTQGGHLPASKKILQSEEFKTKPYYTKYLKEFGDPENFVMLGNTPYYEAVYDQLKWVYMDVFDANKKNSTVKDIIASRYQEALDLISGLNDL